MPNPLPLPMMFVQRLVMLASSPALRVAGVNFVSVVAIVTATSVASADRTWRVVPHAASPVANGNPAEPASAALFEQLVPVKPAPAPVLTSFIITEFGVTPVSVFLVRSFFTDRETSPLGVTKQEQHDTNCSSAENAYTFTQRFPTALPNPGPFNDAPFAPVLVMSTTESPMLRLAAYRTWKGELSVGIGFTVTSPIVI